MPFVIHATRRHLHGKPPGGTHVKILTGMLALFFLGLKFGQILFFWVGKIFSYFSGFCKISTIFLGLTNYQLFFGSANFCITHLKPLNEEHTVLKNKIIVAFYIYSNFDNHCILSHSIFLGLNFGAFYFFGFKFRVILYFWAVEICSWTSIPVKKMLVCPPPRAKTCAPLSTICFHLYFHPVVQNFRKNDSFAGEHPSFG